MCDTQQGMGNLPSEYIFIINLLQFVSSDVTEQSNCWSHFHLASMHYTFLH